MDTEGDSVWAKKGATLSDKSAREEFGLTQEEIVQAIKNGKLQYRKTYAISMISAIAGNTTSWSKQSCQSKRTRNTRVVWTVSARVRRTMSAACGAMPIL